LVEAIPADQGAVSVAATKAVSPVLGAASYRRAVKQLLTSVVREICTLRSVGAGVRATVPGHPVGTRRLLSLPRSSITQSDSVHNAFFDRPIFVVPNDFRLIGAEGRESRVEGTSGH